MHEQRYSKWNAKRVAFLKKYRALARVAFEHEPGGWHTPAGQRIIQLARKQLKYSPNYVNCDLFCAFNALYQRTFKKKKNGRLRR